MGTKDPRVDAYIARAAPFAHPILMHLRAVMHAASPHIDEDMKWSFPHFMYKGILASMASFKAHCAFGFWKGSLIVGNGDRRAGAMGQFGRITSVQDLPPKRVLTSYVNQALKLNDDGVASPTRSTPKPKTPLVVPGDLAAALRTRTKAQATFEGFPRSQQREYVEWITEAGTEATRRKRLATAVAWMSEGKRRLWKSGA